MPRQKVPVKDAESVIPETILKLLKTQKQVCADDVHLRLDVPPECMKFMAPAFRGLQSRGRIHIVAIKNTPRDGQHGNRVAIWELVPNSDMGNGTAAVPRPKSPRGDHATIQGTVSK